MCLIQQLCVKCGFIYSFIHSTDIFECVLFIRHWARGSGTKEVRTQTQFLRSLKSMLAVSFLLSGVSLICQYPIQMCFPELDIIFPSGLNSAEFRRTIHD